MSVARRLNFRSTGRIGVRTMGCSMPRHCPFTADLGLRSSVPAFQRNHSKKAGTFFSGTLGSTSRPSHPLHDLPVAPLLSLLYSTFTPFTISCLRYATLHSWPGGHPQGPSCSRHLHNHIQSVKTHSIEKLNQETSCPQHLYSIHTIFYRPLYTRHARSLCRTFPHRSMPKPPSSH
jgi:hypothetical protein